MLHSSLQGKMTDPACPSVCLGHPKTRLRRQNIAFASEASWILEGLLAWIVILERSCLELRVTEIPDKGMCARVLPLAAQAHLG